MESNVKPIYVQFSFRHFKKEDRLVMAVAAYADADAKKLLGLQIQEVRAWSSNNYVKVIQSYANALNYIYAKQDKFAEAGFNSVIIMTSNKILHGWLLNGQCNGHAKWFELANKPFRSGARKEIALSVGLGQLCTYDAVYKYCRLDMVEGELHKTYKGVRKLTDAEVKAKEEKQRTEGIETEIGFVTLDDLLAMEGQAADIAFTGFIEG